MQELIKFLTREFVQYMGMPRTERREKKLRRKEERGLWAYHWFGLLPASLRMVGQSLVKLWLVLTRGWVSR